MANELHVRLSSSTLVIAGPRTLIRRSTPQNVVVEWRASKFPFEGENKVRVSRKGD